MKPEIILHLLPYSLQNHPVRCGRRGHGRDQFGGRRAAQLGRCHRTAHAIVSGNGCRRIDQDRLVSTVDRLFFSPLACKCE